MADEKRVNKLGGPSLREAQSFVGQLGGDKRKFTEYLKRKQGIDTSLDDVLKGLGLPNSASLTDDQITKAVDILGERELRKYQKQASEAADPKEMKKTPTKLNKGKKGKKGSGTKSKSRTEHLDYRGGGLVSFMKLKRG
jgi:hypothetical protein